MNINDLETLVCVIRNGSFAAAARELAVDPSSISRTVAALESELGTKLLQRNTRQLSLTEAGTVFTERLAPVLEELAQARIAALDTTSVVRGRLKITVSNAFGMRCVSPLLPAFCDTYPEVELDLVMTESPVDLIAERVDVAIRVGNLRDSSLVAVPLLQVRYHVVASPEWIRRHGPSLSRPEDLASVPCLCFAMLGFRDHWHFTAEGQTQAIDVAVRPRMVATNALLLRECALAGVGPTLLADWMVGSDLLTGALVDLFPAYSVSTANAPTTAWAVYPSRTHVPAKVRAFIEFMRTAMQVTSGVSEPG